MLAQGWVDAAIRSGAFGEAGPGPQLCYHGTSELPKVGEPHMSDETIHLKCIYDVAEKILNQGTLVFGGTGNQQEVLRFEVPVDLRDDLAEVVHSYHDFLDPDFP